MIKKHNTRKVVICMILMFLSSIIYSQSERKKWERFVKESVPELDNRFKFNSTSDKNKAISSTVDIVLWQHAISDDTHPSPTTLEIDNYTCLKCGKVVSLNTFQEDPRIIALFPMEYCGNKEQTTTMQINQTETPSNGNYMDGSVHDYNAGDDGTGFTASRFLNSPCYGDLGFSPFMNRTALDKKYCECENQKRWKQFGLGAIIATLIGVVGLMVWLSRRKSKNSA